MAAFNYARFKETADRLITRFGRPATIRVTSTRTGAVSPVQPWAPGPAPVNGSIQTDYPCVVVAADYTIRDRGTRTREEAAGGTHIREGERRVLVGGLRGLVTIPSDAILLWGSEVLTVMSSKPVDPAGSGPVVHDMQVVR